MIEQFRRWESSAEKARYVSFFQWLRRHGLNGVKLIVGGKRMGMLEAVREAFPDVNYQLCSVHFYRNVFSVVPRSKVKIAAKILQATHAQKNRTASPKRSNLLLPN